MDQAILDIVQGGLTLESLVLVLQIIVAAFLVLMVRSWIMKTWAWHLFRKSTVMGIGTVVKATVNGTFVVEGVVRKADKGRVVIRSEDSTVYIPTVEFVKQSWTIKDPNTRRSQK
jgi:hypothetical protein